MKEGIPAERSERILWIGEGMGLGEIMAERDDSKHLCLLSLVFRSISQSPQRSDVEITGNLVSNKGPYGAQGE